MKKNSNKDISKCSCVFSIIRLLLLLLLLLLLPAMGYKRMKPCNAPPQFTLSADIMDIDLNITRNYKLEFANINGELRGFSFFQRVKTNLRVCVSQV